MTVKVVGVGTLDSYRIWVRFDDGTSGDIDLAHLAELPMHKPWHDPAVFATVRVGPYGHTVIWYTPPVDVDLVAHWLYTEITGVTMPEVGGTAWPQTAGSFRALADQTVGTVVASPPAPEPWGNASHAQQVTMVELDRFARRGHPNMYVRGPQPAAHTRIPSGTPPGSRKSTPSPPKGGMPRKKNSASGQLCKREPAGSSRTVGLARSGNHPTANGPMNLPAPPVNHRHTPANPTPN